MIKSQPFKIKLEEKFPHLSKAPIMECVLELRARAETPWEENAIREPLVKQLPDYPKFQSEQEFQAELTLQAKEKQAEHTFKDLGLKGIIFRTNDEKQIARFHRDLFSFSKLHPYDDWSQFSTEALRLWAIHRELARPIDIQRIGLRFINHISVPTGTFKLEDYLRIYPKEPYGLPLPFGGFFHKDRFAVPGYNYFMDVVKTIQPDPKTMAVSLVIDIDVFTGKSIAIEDAGCLKKCLLEMWWLKNKAFFGSITKKTMEMLK